MRLLPAAALLTLSLASLPTSAEAQTVFGLRYGHGGGSSHYRLAELNTRIHVAKRLYAIANYQIMGGDWACPGGPIEDLRCEYDGNSISVGVATAAIDTRDVFLALNGTVGSFERTGGSGPYTGQRHFTGSIGVDGEIKVIGPVRVQAGLNHRRVFDSEYRRVFGGSPNVTSITAGLSFVFGRPNPN